jgi:hypothetical protein
MSSMYFIIFGILQDFKPKQWRAGYYFSGGGNGLLTNMRPYNVTLEK